ncbi:hypothetical protein CAUPRSCDRAFT_12727 [Caulochytrium protostelioides]|uniref:Uncharacterized protein n=1 Tax=Caulochytrium protostelioides TaxID=1555241 RepID=A0A4P9WWI5_9FUNG|nr:hypothetical protein CAUPRSCDRAFT_12727 [Caulochytrium protostelioides]
MQLLIRGRHGLLPILLQAFLKHPVVAALPTNNEQQQHGFDANAATRAERWSFDSTSQPDPHISMAPVTYDGQYPSFIPSYNAYSFPSWIRLADVSDSAIHISCWACAASGQPPHPV